MSSIVNVNLILEKNDIGSVKGFKTNIKNSSYTHIVPSYYFTGDRYLTVLHARIITNLNNELFSNDIRNDPSCLC